MFWQGHMSGVVLDVGRRLWDACLAHTNDIIFLHCPNFVLLLGIRMGLLLQPGISTDLIDKKVHQMIIDNGAYPSPLTYGTHISQQVLAY